MEGAKEIGFKGSILWFYPTCYNKATLLIILVIFLKFRAINSFMFLIFNIMCP